MINNKFILHRMYATVEFDRPINPNLHFVSPGGYEAKFSNGKTLQFDFEEYEGGVVNNHPTLLEFVHKNPDFTTFPNIQDFTSEDFQLYFDGFEEFYLYTGEYNDLELVPLRVTECYLEFYNKDKDWFVQYTVPDHLLPDWSKDYDNIIEK